MKSKSVCVDTFKQAMGNFPSGVTIVTTVDKKGNKYGFTASAFSSLSLSPPLILVCLACNADCYESFNKTNKFAVNIISSEHEGLAFKFSTKGCDKFEGNEFAEGSSGLPILPSCSVSLECRTDDIHLGGDHIILIGEVEYLSINNKLPTVWHQGSFHKLQV
jgi:flavin reductase ActVB